MNYESDNQREELYISKVNEIKNLFHKNMVTDAIEIIKTLIIDGYDDDTIAQDIFGCVNEIDKKLITFIREVYC